MKRYERWASGHGVSAVQFIGLVPSLEPGGGTNPVSIGSMTPGRMMGLLITSGIFLLGLSALHGWVVADSNPSHQECA